VISVDHHMEAIERKLDSCRNCLISTFEDDSETKGEPSCASIVATLESRTDNDQSKYIAFAKKLDDEELSEVSDFRCRSMRLYLR